MPTNDVSWDNPSYEFDHPVSNASRKIHATNDKLRKEGHQGHQYYRLRKDSIGIVTTVSLWRNTASSGSYETMSTFARAYPQVGPTIGNQENNSDKSKY